MSHLKTMAVIMAVLLTGLIALSNYGPIADFNKALSGKAIAAESPLAAMVIDNYRECLHPGLFSSTSAVLCKVSIAQLVKLEKGESAVHDAMTIIDKYEDGKLQALGIKQN